MWIMFYDIGEWHWSALEGRLWKKFFSFLCWHLEMLLIDDDRELAKNLHKNKNNTYWPSCLWQSKQSQQAKKQPAASYVSIKHCATDQALIICSHLARDRKRKRANNHHHSSFQCLILILFNSLEILFTRTQPNSLLLSMVLLMISSLAVVLVVVVVVAVDSKIDGYYAIGHLRPIPCH